MNESKIIYWSLVLVMAVIVILGVRLAFSADRLLEQRGNLVQARLGKKGVAFFVSSIRILSMTAAVLALYLLINLLRIFQCAIK